MFAVVERSSLKKKTIGVKCKRPLKDASLKRTTKHFDRNTALIGYYLKFHLSYLIMSGTIGAFMYVQLIESLHFGDHCNSLRSYDVFE